MRICGYGWMGVVLGLGSASDVVLMADGSLVGISCPVYAALSYPALFSSSPANKTVCCTDECVY